MRFRPLLVAVCFLLLAAAHAASGSAASSTTLQVSFIDVGQGDAVLIRDLAGFDALIDGGMATAGPTVVAYLRQQGIDSIEVMLATHADADHIGGLVDVLQLSDITVGSVLYNGYPGTTATWNTFAAAVADELLTLQPARYPQTYSFGPAAVQVLNPVSAGAYAGQNEASVVLRLSHGSVDFLLTGDVPATTESDILRLGLPLEAEVLKVAHHGSDSSSSADFLAAVAPKEAVISVGEDNQYGHPGPETLARLEAVGARTWRTDKSGTVVVASNGTDYIVLPGRGGQYKVCIPLVVLSQ